MKNILLLLLSVMLLVSCKREYPQLPASQPEKTAVQPDRVMQHKPLLDTLKTGADSLKPKPIHINPEAECYAVLNYCLSEPRIAGRVEEMTGYFGRVNKDDIKAKYFTGLSKEDVNYMHGQATDTVSVRINTLKLARPVKIVTHEDHKGKASYGYVSLSKPLFSKDYTTAIIVCENYCGALCGSGALYVLKKDSHGKWKIADMRMLWIS